MKYTLETHCYVQNNKKSQTQLQDEVVTNDGGEELETDNADTYPGKKCGSEVSLVHKICKSMNSQLHLEEKESAVQAAR